MALTTSEPGNRLSITTVALAVVALTVSGIVLLLGERSDWGKRLEAGERVPQFSLRLDDGRMVSSRSLLGRRYLIAFFRPDCDFCKTELPWIARATPPDGMPVLFAVSSGSAAATAQFWKEMALSLPTAVDHDRLVANAFHVRRVPTLVAVTREGTIDQVRLGLTSRVELARILQVIGARPPQGPQRSAGEPMTRRANDPRCSAFSDPRGQEIPCGLVGGDWRAEAQITSETR